MFLLHKPTKTLIEIQNIEQLFNPCQTEVTGIMHAGEELQDSDTYLKSEMIFPSGEVLPRCWLDLHYRESKSENGSRELSFAVN